MTHATPVWQLTVDCHDPNRQARFWALALGFVPQPPPDGHDSWVAWYRSVGVPEDELAEIDEADIDRIVHPDGGYPTIWFQQVPETKTLKNRLHLDVYPTGRDRGMAFAERKRLVEAKVAELVAAGATVRERPHDIDAAEGDAYFVGMYDPEGNEFCVS